jgi:hypothetical protein
MGAQGNDESWLRRFGPRDDDCPSVDLWCSSRSESSFDRTLKAPHEVRAFVQRALCRAHARRALGPVRLAASEYSTEATLQGDGPFLVRLVCDVTTVTLTVVYASTGVLWRPEVLQPTKMSFQIIDNISRASGREVEEHECTLWCSIPTGSTRGGRAGRYAG